jgi:hypothetical protein
MVGRTHNQGLSFGDSTIFTNLYGLASDVTAGNKHTVRAFQLRSVKVSRSMEERLRPELQPYGNKATRRL